MSHEIVTPRRFVKYHNDMNSVAFTRLSPTDRKAFMAICYDCKEEGTKDHYIYLDVLKELSGYESKDNKRFLGYIEGLAEKLQGAYYKIKKEDGGFKTFSLFQTFETTPLTDARPALRVKVSEEFSYILNSNAETPEGILPLLSGGYTSFELDQFTSLKSTYSMETYRQLKRFKRTGWWHVSMDEFRRLMDIPESYRLPDIRRRVFGPINDELTACFENLAIEEIKGKGENGRKTTVALKFTFKPQKDKGVWYKNDAKAILKDEYKCPYCGESLYAIAKDNGEVFYGHIDGWKENAKCRRTFGSYDEILGLNGDIKIEDDKKQGVKPKLERAGFSCRECGEPLYILHNEKGEMFYGHADGWKKGAKCSRTYGSVAEIKGFSETPTREDYYNLVDKDESDEVQKTAYGVFETVKSE